MTELPHQASDTQYLDPARDLDKLHRQSDLTEATR